MFNKNLKALRLRAGLSQKQVAEYLTISPQSVSKWENGDALPSIDFLPKLLEILNCDINAFFAEEKAQRFNYSDLEAYFELMDYSMKNDSSNSQEIADFVWEHPDILDTVTAVCLELKEYKTLNARIVQGLLNCSDHETTTFMRYFERFEMIEKLDIDDAYFVIKDSVDGFVVLLKVQKELCEAINKDKTNN